MMKVFKFKFTYEAEIEIGDDEVVELIDSLPGLFSPYDSIKRVVDDFILVEDGRWEDSKVYDCEVKIGDSKNGL